MQNGCFGWLMARVLPGGALRLAHPSAWARNRFGLLPGDSPLPDDTVVYRRSSPPLACAARNDLSMVLVQPDQVTDATIDGMLRGPTRARIVALRAGYRTARSPTMLRRARRAAARYGVPLYRPQDSFPHPADWHARFQPDTVDTPEGHGSSCPPDALIGVRGFRLFGLALGAMALEDMWLPGDNEAWCAGVSRCTRVASITACHCGMNAFHTLAGLDAYAAGVPSFQPDVIAAVAGWGTVSVHRDGWRSQYARVLAVASDRGGAQPARRAAVARAYRVPAVPARDLTAVASEYGVRAADDQLPAWD